MTLRALFSLRPPLALVLTCALAGCWGSDYKSIEGHWQGELKGQRIQAEFRPSEDAVVLDGRAGSMRLKGQNGATIALEMTGPDGRTGEAVITLIDDSHLRLEIPLTMLSVEFERRD